MTEMDKYILELIKKNATINEISKETNLSNKQLLNRINILKNSGYNLKEKYYSDGEISYEFQKGINNTVEKSIITRKNEDAIKILFISDLHLGNINERLDLLNEIYSFCVNNNIHIIINTGDIVEGTLNCGRIKEKYINTFEEQVDLLLKKYPYDKKILNFLCFGNHDYSWLKEFGYDLSKKITNCRTDLIPLGYGCGKLNIKNDYFILFHSIPEINGLIPDEQCRFRIYGHSHKFKLDFPQNGYLRLYLPSLSDILTHVKGYSYHTLPSMVVGKFYMNNGLFINGLLEQYVYVNENFVRVNEININMSYGKNMSPKKVINEEERFTLKQINLIDLFNIYKEELNLSDSNIKEMVTTNNFISNKVMCETIENIKKLELKRYNNILLNRNRLNNMNK